MAVRTWPTYLLRDIEPGIRKAIEADAELDGASMIEVVRGILCGHYALDCEPVETSVRSPEKITGTDTMVLRLQPALWEAIKADAGPTYGATRKTITDILQNYYSVRS